MAITLVQHASSTTQFTSGTSGTASATFTSNITATNCVICTFTICALNKSFSLGTPSVTTNGSADNWASVLLNTGDASLPVGIWADPNAAGSQKIIDVAVSFGATASTSESVAICIDIFEVSGLTTSSPTDKTSHSNSASATTWSSGTTGTTSQAAEFWVGVAGFQVVADDTTQTVTPPSSVWTNESLLSTSIQSGGTILSDKFFVYQQSGYQVTSATGTATYSGTNSQSSDYNASVATFNGAASNVNVSLTVAQVNISAPAPTIKISPSLTVAQVNVAAYTFKTGAGPIALPVAQVNVNALAPKTGAGPISLPVAQVNISAYPPAPGSNNVMLSAAQVSINALPFILVKTFALPLAQVSISAYPPGISRPGMTEDSIVPLMITGVYSNV